MAVKTDRCECGYMFTKLGNLFQRNKTTEDDSLTKSDMDIRVLAADEQQVNNSKKRSLMRHSWTSGQSISIHGSTEGDTEPNLSEELTSNGTESLMLDTSEIITDCKSATVSPRAGRSQTFTGKFFNWLQREDKDKKNQNKPNSLSETQLEIPRTTVNMPIPARRIDEVIIENYTPGPNAGKKSLLELMQLAGHVEDTYRVNNSELHIQTEFQIFTNEKLENSFSCSVWVEDRVFLGEIHITEENICFDSLPNAICKFIVPLQSIDVLEVISESQISESCWFSWETLTTPPVNSIHVYSTFKRYFFFGFQTNQSEECFRILKTLTSNLQNSISKSSQKLKSPLLPRNEEKKEKSQILQANDTGDNSFEEEFLETVFPYVLPIQLMIDENCEVIRGIHHMGEGKLYLSAGCLCFHSHDLNASDWICVTIALSDINQIKKADKGAAIQILSRGNELLFYPSDCKSCFLIIEKNWKEKRLSLCRDLVGLWGLENNERQVMELNGRQAYFLSEIKFDRKDKKLLEAWKNYFKTYGTGFEVIIKPSFCALLHRGISHEYRGYIWQLASGSLHRLKMFGGNEISRLLDHVYDNESSVPRKEIEKDLHRSLPRHPHFDAGGTGIQELRRVLCAYALRNPDIGYCQSMNIVCAVFLLFMSEEEVFWLLTVVAEKLLPGYYSSPLAGLMTDQHIVQILVQEKLPGLVEHLQYLGITLSILTMPWFLCLFINFLPWNATLRVLDSFFINGPVILFQVTLAILALEKDNIMKQTDGIELFNLTKRVSTNPEKLFKLVEKDFQYINMELISKLRTEYRPKIVAELGAYTQILDNLSDEDSDSSQDEEASGGIFVPYVPSNPPKDRDNSVKPRPGYHRELHSVSAESDRKSVAATIQKRWNHSVNSLLPKVRGHRRLHSDGRVFLRPKVRIRTSSSSIEPNEDLTPKETLISKSTDGL